MVTRLGEGVFSGGRGQFFLIIEVERSPHFCASFNLSIEYLCINFDKNMDWTRGASRCGSAVKW
jgi:hypothetical protein